MSTASLVPTGNSPTTLYYRIAAIIGCMIVCSVAYYGLTSPYEHYASLLVSCPKGDASPLPPAASDIHTYPSTAPVPITPYTYTPQTPPDVRKAAFPCQQHPTECTGACDAIRNHILHWRATASWNQYYADISAFMKEKRLDNGIIIEIGTAFGGLAASLLTACPNLQLHVVDPFLAGYDPNDAIANLYNEWKTAFNLNDEQFSQTWAKAMAFDMGERFGCRYFLHHNLSVLGARDFPTFSVDSVFIDGLHTFEGVYDDIRMYTSKVQPGGALIFNDYDHAGGGFVGVKKAVDLFGTAWLQDLTIIGAKEMNNVALFVPDLSHVMTHE